MKKYYRLDIGYNGADITDIAIQVNAPVERVNWLVRVIQSGFTQEGISSGFVNVVGQDSFASFNRRNYINSESELPEPFTMNDDVSHRIA